MPLPQPLIFRLGNPIPDLYVSTLKDPVPSLRNSGNVSRPRAVTNRLGLPSLFQSRKSTPMLETGIPSSVKATKDSTPTSSKLLPPRFLNRKFLSLSFATKISIQPSPL